MRFSRRRRPRFEHLPIDELGALIQESIEDLEAKGEISREDFGSPPPRYDGYCARASQAYVSLLKWPEAARLSAYPGLKLRRRVPPGRPSTEGHYWLQEGEDRILDLNYAPDEKHNDDFPYEESESARYRRMAGDGRYPQRRDTRKMIDWVLAKTQ